MKKLNGSGFLAELSGINRSQHSFAPDIPYFIN